MDRKVFWAFLNVPLLGSLSARRAWIENLTLTVRNVPIDVALRKESVDRKLFVVSYFVPALRSLSARRAWIEKSMGLDGRFKL